MPPCRAAPPRPCFRATAAQPLKDEDAKWGEHERRLHNESLDHAQANTQLSRQLAALEKQSGWWRQRFVDYFAPEIAHEVAALRELHARAPDEARAIDEAGGAGGGLVGAALAMHSAGFVEQLLVAGLVRTWRELEPGWQPPPTTDWHAKAPPGARGALSVGAPHASTLAREGALGHDGGARAHTVGVPRPWDARRAPAPAGRAPRSDGQAASGSGADGTGPKRGDGASTEAATVAAATVAVAVMSTRDLPQPRGVGRPARATGGRLLAAAAYDGGAGARVPPRWPPAAAPLVDADDVDDPVRVEPRPPGRTAGRGAAVLGRTGRRASLPSSFSCRPPLAAPVMPPVGVIRPAAPAVDEHDRSRRRRSLGDVLAASRFPPLAPRTHAFAFASTSDAT